MVYFDQYLHKKEGQSDDIIIFLVLNVIIPLAGWCSGSRVHFQMLIGHVTTHPSCHQPQSDLHHYSAFVLIIFYIWDGPWNLSTATAISWQEWALLYIYIYICDLLANFSDVMTIFLVMVKGYHSLFGIYLRNKDSWSHFVTTSRNITASCITLPPISFLGQKSHSTRNTATCLAPLTKSVAPFLSFTNIYK